MTEGRPSRRSCARLVLQFVRQAGFGLNDDRELFKGMGAGRRASQPSVRGAKCCATDKPLQTQTLDHEQFQGVVVSYACKS